MFSKSKPGKIFREDAAVADTSDVFVMQYPCGDMPVFALFAALREASLNTAGSWFFRLMTAVGVLISLAGASFAAGIRIVPSSQKVSAGESFYADVVVDDIPAGGLGAVQFRMNIHASGSEVAAVSDTLLGLPSDVSVSSPLSIGPSTAGRSGIGDFFWNAKGSHGILVMENEALQNGSGLYTLGHTIGAALPSGSGTIARFQIHAGKDVAAEQILLSLSEVALLDGASALLIDSAVGATVDLKCFAQVPNLIGMSKTRATAALTAAKLAPGAEYEIDNSAGAYSLNVVLVQSANEGTALPCGTPVDMAINLPPVDAGNVSARDKPGDESGAVILSWIPSASADAAGYRVYDASGARIAGIEHAAAAGVEISGLASGAAAQLRITAYDTYGNESPGVSVFAVALDDVAPRISISGVSDGAYYATDIQPVITVQDANPVTGQFTLNDAPYAQAPITLAGTYLLTISATDAAGNSSSKAIRFTIDKTPPAITVAGLTKGFYYNTDVGPIISVTDADLEATEAFLNGSPFAGGTRITAENDYELLVRAVDKAGNTASESYVFHIDKTRPTSAASVGTPRFSDRGTLYVARATQITLTGDDAGAVVSGVEKLEYRANNGLWSRYQTPVVLTGMNDGPVAIDFRAVDKAANIEDLHSLAVVLDNTPPQTTVSGSDSLIDGVVNAVSPSTFFALAATDALAGVRSIAYRINNDAWQTYTGSFSLADMPAGRYTIGFKATDNVLNEETEKTIAVRLVVMAVEKKISIDPAVLVGYESDKTDLDRKQAAVQSLSSLLSSLGIAHAVAHGSDELAAAMRSGRYTAYVLIDVKQPLLSQEIREAVNNGEGLIYIKTRPDADPFLDEVFGLRFSGGTTGDNLTVTMQPSLISQGTELQMAGKSVVSIITSTAAQTYATVADNKDVHPAIVFNQYGRGKALFYTFDLLNSPDQATASAVMVASLNLVNPQDRAPRALDNLPVRITIKNSPEPADVRLVELFPSGTSVDTIVPAPVSADNRAVTWQKHLAEDEAARFRYYLSLPDMSGSYVTKTELAYGNNGFFRPYGSRELPLAVPYSSGELLGKIVADLKGLHVATVADAELTAATVDELLLLNMNAADRKEAENNLRIVVGAINDVRKLTIDASAVRADLDELLRISERKWHLLKAQK